jgi:hypothetical protein
MKIFIAIILFMHGFIHLFGFVVPWKITKLEEMPYKTTVLNGSLNIGDLGIRIVGVLWLLIAIAFFLSIYLMFSQNPFWFFFTVIVTLISIVLCILGWPDSKIGVFANLFILLLLIILQWFDWIILD